MSGLAFVSALDLITLKRHYEHPGAGLWPKVVSLFLIKDKAYFHFNHFYFFNLRDFTRIAPAGIRDTSHYVIDDASVMIFNVGKSLYYNKQKICLSYYS